MLAYQQTHQSFSYASAYKEQDNTHFEPFVLESGGVFGERATEVFKKLCNIITQQAGRSASNISYFWKAKLLVLFAKVTHNNAIKWALAHNRPHDPNSTTTDLTDFYDDPIARRNQTNAPHQSRQKK